jgi:hypothetical protein
MSKINLPPLPPIPDEIMIDEGIGDCEHSFGQDEAALRAWATAYATQAVREALAAQVAALHAFADRQYCIGFGYGRCNEGLGWEQKAKTGRFGAAEYECHKKMHEAFGAHFGVYEALKQLAPSKEPSND